MTFTSHRLIYRAVDEMRDTPLLHAWNKEAEDQLQNLIVADAAIPRPVSIQDAAQYLQICKASILFVIVCIPAKSVPAGFSPTEMATPIGSACLHPILANAQHHRSTTMGLQLAKEHRYQGYGPEICAWMLDQAFLRFGLHRIELRVWEWNEPAKKAYRRVGFRKEGVRVKVYWHEGGWHDEEIMAMLDDEWKAKKADQGLA